MTKKKFIYAALALHILGEGHGRRKPVTADMLSAVNEYQGLLREEGRRKREERKVHASRSHNSSLLTLNS